MDSLMRSISRTHRCCNRYYNETLSGDGISGNQYIYIFQVCRHPGISQDALTQRLAVNKSSVTRQLATLEQNGFVTRHPAPEDKRSLLVYPTEKAQALYPKVLEGMRRWNRLLLEDLSPQEQELLMDLISRVEKKAIALAEQEEKAQ